MKRIITMTALFLFSGAGIFCLAQEDTLGISTAYTTHLIFSSDITYADLSSPADVAAKVIEQNRNMLALKARTEFQKATSVSALESNGDMHTFIVIYEASPKRLIIDLRDKENLTANNNASGVSIGGRADSPSLDGLNRSKQRLFHLGSRKYKVVTLCENIVSYSDVTYLTISVKNSSSVSYSITDAVFVLESNKRSKRAVAFEKTLVPKNRHGSLSADTGGYSRITYSFDKLTLSEGQIIKVYLYEQGGQRNLEFAIDNRDINNAGTP